MKSHPARPAHATPHRRDGTEIPSPRDPRRSSIATMGQSGSGRARCMPGEKIGRPFAVISSGRVDKRIEIAVPATTPDG